MKNNILLFSCILLFSFHFTNAQEKSLSDYSFVSVPSKFDFLKKKDQYQLNSITKFLFNKHGFNAYFEEELPNVSRCDGLYAKIIGEPKFIYTRVTIVLNDCNGNEVYRSETGKSKLKQYDKTYNEALRKAFLSFDEMEINQADLDVKPKDDAEKVTPKEETKPVVTSNSDAATKENEAETGPSLIPQGRFTNYISKNSSYLLKKTNTGYSLYEEMNTLEDEVSLQLRGKVIIEGETILFEDSFGNRTNASFDSLGNLIIEKTSGTEKEVYQKQ